MFRTQSRLELVNVISGGDPRLGLYRNGFFPATLWSSVPDSV